MIDSESVVEALLDWVAEVLPELQGGYNHVPSAKPLALPDVVVEVQRTEVSVGGGDRFAMIDLQQAFIYAVEANLSFMVDNSDTQAAAEQLRDFENRLLLAAIGDGTLGGRVRLVAPSLEFDFDSPYVEYEDGTKGREMTMTIAVGDLVEATS